MTASTLIYLTLALFYLAVWLWWGRTRKNLKNRKTK